MSRMVKVKKNRKAKIKGGSVVGDLSALDKLERVEMARIVNRITTGGGTFEVLHKPEVNKDGEMYTTTKITKVAEFVHTIPKHSLLDRLKYVFTNELKDIEIIERKLR